MGKCEPAAHIERVRVGNPPPKVARAALLPDGLVFGFQTEGQVMTASLRAAWRGGM